MARKSRKVKKIVIKIGSRVLTGSGGKIDDFFLERFVGDIAELHKKGFDIVLVSSGAIRTGAPILKLDLTKVGISQKQAAAAVGQGLLIAKYNELFSRHNITVAQILLTPDIVNERQKYLNARNTLRTLIDMKIIPIVNENDTISYEEIKFGDNDKLSAITVLLIEADVLINLSDVVGLCSDDPQLCERVNLVNEVNEITQEIIDRARGPRLNGGGTGGMATKIEAAQIAMECGTKMIIADGREPNIIKRILDGEKIGTTFVPHDSGLNSRKKWLAFGCQTEGRIFVNDGAKLMIMTKGKSLLPSGVIGVDGNFDHGTCVEVCGENQRIFAKGLSNYSSNEIVRLQGKQSSEINKLLGFKISDVIVHRDDLVLI
ncbi:MAG TPA: glutamate 5-kinase [bacterium]|nr:glutamate 5-kinase [bacterium]